MVITFIFIAQKGKSTMVKGQATRSLITCQCTSANVVQISFSGD